jgi:hypothetical protein
MRRLPVLVVAGFAALTACSSTHYVTVSGKQQECVNSTTHQVVSDRHCSSSNSDDSWYYLMLMNNGSTYNVPSTFYNSTSVGKKVDEDDEDLDEEVDENGNTITDAPPDEDQGNSGDDQDGDSGDSNDGDSGSSDGDDGGDSGGDDGGGGDD